MPTSGPDPRTSMSLDDSADHLLLADLSIGHDSSSHLVQFYENDAYLVDSVSRTIGESLENGDGAVIIATRAHREALEERLTTNGLDLRSIAPARPLSFSRCERNIGEDFSRRVSKSPLASTRLSGAAIAKTSDASPRHFTRAFGEMVALLWAQGKRDAALRLEALWNDLAKRMSFALCCAYPAEQFLDRAGW